MRDFVVVYNSSSNVFKGQIHVRAYTVFDAQDKFFNWLREQPVYPHMWDLSIKLVEIKGSLS